MKVTTLFGSATSSSSGGGMVNNTSVGVNDKSNKNSKNKIEDHHSFIPVQVKSTAVKEKGITLIASFTHINYMTNETIEFPPIP